MDGEALPADQELDRLQHQLRDALQTARAQVRRRGNSNRLLPPAERVPDADQASQARDAAVLEASRAPPLPPAVVEADVLRHDAAVAGSRSGEPAALFPQVLAFLAARREALAWRRYQLSLRESALASDCELLQRSAPALRRAEAALRAELIDVDARLVRLRRAHEDAAAAPSGLELGLAEAALQPEDVCVLMRSLAHAHNATRATHRFFKRVRWLPFTRRFAVLKRAHKLEAEARPPQAPGADEEVDDDEADRGQTPPTLREPVARLSRSVQELLDCLRDSVPLEREYDTGDLGALHKLDAMVGRCFPRVFAQQERELDVHTHESELQPPDRAEDAHYVKAATWLPFAPTEHAEALFPPHNDQLAGPQDDDEGLRAELAFLEARDATEASNRVKADADALAERLRAVEGAGDMDVRTALRKAAAPVESGGGSSESDEDDDGGQPRMTDGELARRHLLRIQGRLRLLHSRASLLRLRDALNYFRAVQRQLAVEATGYLAVPDDADAEDPPKESTKPQSAQQAVEWACATSPVLPRLHAQHTRPADLARSPAAIVEARRLATCEDRASVEPDTGRLRLRDRLGHHVLYDCTLVDADQLQGELVLVAAHYVRRLEQSQTTKADRAAVLCELLESEALFQEAKARVVRQLMAAHQHVCDAEERDELARQALAVAAARPRLDLEAGYFTASYAAEIVCLDLLGRQLRDLATAQVCAHRAAAQRVHAALGEGDFDALFGLPWRPDAGSACPPVALQPEALPVAVDEFVPSLGALARFVDLARASLAAFARVHQPASAAAAVALQRAVLLQVAVEWRLEQDEQEAEEADEPVQPVALEQACIAEEREMSEHLEDAHERARPSLRADAGVAELQRKKDSLRLRTYCNGVELVQTWAALREARLECELLGGAHREQAKQLARGATAAHVFEKQTGTALVPAEKRGKRVPPVPSDITRAADALAGKPRRWALSAVDASVTHLPRMAAVDELRALVRLESQDGQLHVLRAALQTQVAHRVVLYAAVAAHQLALDPALAFQARYEAAAVQQTFITLRDHEANESESSYRRIEQQRQRLELVKAGLDAKLADASRHAGDFAERVAARRDALAAAMERQTSALYRAENRSPQQLADDLRRVKLNLVKAYGVGIVDDVRAETLLPQLEAVLVSLRELAGRLPPGRSPFSVGARELTAEEVRLSGGPTAVSDEDEEEEHEDRSAVAEERAKRTQNLFKPSGELDNPWFLPHPEQLAYLVPRGGDAESLKALLQAWTATRDVAHVACQRAVLLPGTHSVKGAGARRGRLVSPEERWDLVAHELGKLAYETTSAAAAEQSEAATVRLFWQKRRLALHSFALGLRHGVDVLLARGRGAAARCLRAALKAVTAPAVEVDACLVQRPHPRHLALPPTVVSAATRTRARPDSVASLLAQLREAPAEQGRYRWYWGNAIKAPAERAPGPVWGPYLGAPARMPEVRPQLLALSEAEKTYAHGAMMEMEMAIDDATLSDAGGAGVFLTVREQHDFAVAALACLSLRDALVGRLLGARFAEPETAADAEHALDAYAAAVLGRASALLTEAADGLSVQDEAADGDERELMRVLAATRKAVSRTREEKLAELVVARAELEKAVLREQLEHAQALGTRLLVEEARAESADRGERPHAPESAKAVFAAEFRRALMDSAQRCTNRAGEDAVIVSVAALQQHLETFGRELVAWSDGESGERLADAERRAAARAEAVRLRDADVARMQQLLDRQQRDFRQRLDLSVMERNFELVFELDRLRQRVATRDEAVAAAEKRARDAARVELEEQVRDLRLQAMSTESRFAEFRENLQQTMMTQILKAKADMTERMVYSEGSSVEWKSGALRNLQTADTLEEAQAENSALRKAMMKLKTMYEMRDVATATGHSKELRQAQEKLAQYGQLLDEHEETQRQVEMLKVELVAAQSALANANSRADRMQRKMDATRKAHQGLVAGKLKVARQLEEAQKRAEQFEGLERTDVRELMRQLERAEHDLNEATLGTGSAAHAASKAAHATKQVAKLKKALAREQRLKNAAFAKLQQLRDDADPDHGSYRFWRTQYDRVCESYTSLLRQNELMRARFAELGVALPDGIVELAVQPAPRTELEMRLDGSATVTEAVVGVGAPPPAARPTTAGGSRPRSAKARRPQSARPASAASSPRRVVRMVQPQLELRVGR